ARYRRLKGDDVLYVCGSDEYGIAICMSAEKAGRTPQQQVDHFHVINKDLFNRLHFSFDHFSRTTWEGHKVPVQRYFLDLLENGYIEKRTTEQLYSTVDERFLADRYVVGTCPKCGFESARGDECTRCGESYEATDLLNPRAADSGSTLVKRETQHWFLLLDKLKEPLKEWLSKKEWKTNVQRSVANALDELRPRAITRDLEWGIPVPLPDAEGKVLYVWFDAPIGYISASMEWAELQGDPDRWKSYWTDPESELVQFIGKDNLFFHALLFPAMTLGQNAPYKTVDELPANEFLNLEGRQFSKSEGWMIDLDTFFERFTADQIRYTLAANAPESSDSEFTWEDFQRRCNTELVGKFGNLANRVLTFAHKRCEGRAPEVLESDLEGEDRAFLQSCLALLKAVDEEYSHFSLRHATHSLMELAQAGNGYFDKKQPWIDARSEENHPRMRTTIACCLQCLKALALAAAPIIPEAAQRLWKMLGCEGSVHEVSWTEEFSLVLPANQALGEVEVLFSKVEDEVVEEELEKLMALKQAMGGSQA
ncbi:MAG: methionine--tRNA ligase, partial [Chlamydiia bacterium]|nr:methionine--tRNA ligase [Chlamydiia bacterium]